MCKFLQLLWNEGKQLYTFNRDASPQQQVDSDSQTVLRKKHLWGKSQAYEKEWHKNQIFAYM